MNLIQASKYRLLRNIVAIGLIGAQVFMSVPPLEASPDAGTFPEIKIPSEFGAITERSEGLNGKLILYIQDAHDSLEAQLNISKTIQHLVENHDVKTVFEEGYEGTVPTDQLFGKISDFSIREKVSYFLLDKLRIGGAEYAHINRKKEFKLIGADNIKLHLENIQSYKNSTGEKQSTEKDLSALQREITILANRFLPKELKGWMKLKTRFDRRELDLPGYLAQTREIALAKSNLETFQKDYPHIELIISAYRIKEKSLAELLAQVEPASLLHEMNQMESDFSNRSLNNARDRKIFEFWKSFELLQRLSDIEITPEELDAARTSLEKITTKDFAHFFVEQTGRSIVLSKRWEENIRHAIAFYETVCKRDRAIEARLDEFLKLESEKTAVLVFGGFHKDRIKQVLKRKNLSYLVFTPNITSLDPRHQNYYKQLMSVGEHPFEAPLNVRTGSRPEALFEMPSETSERYIAAIERSLKVAKLRGEADISNTLFLRQLEKVLPQEIMLSEKIHSGADAGFGNEMKDTASPAVDSGESGFIEGFQTLQGSLLRTGDRIFLIGDGAEEAQSKIPEAQGVMIENFAGADFEDLGIHKIYVRLTKPQWETSGTTLFRSLLQSSRFSGSIFVEIDGHDFNALTARYSPVWENILTQLRYLNTSITIGTRNTGSKDRRIPPAFNGFVLELQSKVQPAVERQEKVQTEKRPALAVLGKREGESDDTGGIDFASGFGTGEQQEGKPLPDDINVIYHSTWLGALWHMFKGFHYDGKERRVKKVVEISESFFAAHPDNAVKVGRLYEDEHTEVVDTPHITLAFSGDAVRNMNVRFSGQRARKPIPLSALTPKSKKEVARGLLRLSGSSSRWKISRDEIAVGLGYRNWDSLEKRLSLGFGVENESGENGKGTRDEVISLDQANQRAGDFKSEGRGSWEYLLSRSSEWPGLRFFSTERANYIFHPALHIVETQIAKEVLERVDTLVLEDSSIRYRIPTEMFSFMHRGIFDRQISDLFQKVRTMKIPVFFVDVPIKGAPAFSTITNVLSGTIPTIIAILLHSLLSIPLFLPFVSVCLSNLSSAENKWNSLVDYFGLVRFYIVASGFRSAVAARKLEELIAPKLGMRVNRKPVVLIEYGALHHDMKLYLQHRRLRDWVIAFHNIFPNIFRHSNYLNAVGELNFSGSIEKEANPIESNGVQAAVYDMRGNQAASDIAKKPAGFGAGSVAQRWEEQKLRDISSRIAESQGLESIGGLPTHDTKLAFGETRYGRERWGTQKSGADGTIERRFLFVRIAHLFFLDEELYANLDEGIKKELGQNVIRIKNLDQSGLGRMDLANHTATTIIAMMESKLTGKRVIDAGAGDGTLSLAAAKIGARALWLIEKNPESLERARANLALNGLENEKDFHLIESDLQDSQRIAAQIPDTGEPTVIISNIGLWPHAYRRTTNATTIGLIPRIRGITDFIAGGYDVHFNGSSISRDQKLIEESGFKVNRARASLGAPYEQAIAWSAISDAGFGSDATAVGVIAESEIERKSEKIFPEPIPGLPPVSDLVEILRNENVPVIFDAKVGDLTFAYLLRTVDDAAKYIGQVLGGHVFNAAEEKSLVEKSIRGGIFVYSRALMLEAAQTAGLEDSFINKLGASADQSRIVVVSGYSLHHPHRALLEETFHVLENQVADVDPNYRVAQEVVDDLLQLLFFPHAESRWFQSPYTNWTLAEMVALKKKYLKNGKLDPNFQLREVIQTLFHDIHLGGTVEMDGRKAKVSHLLIRKISPDEKGSLHGYFETGILPAFVLALLKSEKFSRYGPLFSSWSFSQGAQPVRSREEYVPVPAGFGKEGKADFSRDSGVFAKSERNFLVAALAALGFQSDSNLSMVVFMGGVGLVFLIGTMRLAIRRIHQAHQRKTKLRLPEVRVQPREGDSGRGFGAAGGAKLGRESRHAAIGGMRVREERNQLGEIRTTVGKKRETAEGTRLANAFNQGHPLAKIANIPSYIFNIIPDVYNIFPDIFNIISDVYNIFPDIFNVILDVFNIFPDAFNFLFGRQSGNDQFDRRHIFSQRGNSQFDRRHIFDQMAHFFLNSDRILSDIFKPFAKRAELGTEIFENDSPLAILGIRRSGFGSFRHAGIISGMGYHVNSFLSNINLSIHQQLKSPADARPQTAGFGAAGVAEALQALQRIDMARVHDRDLAELADEAMSGHQPRGGASVELSPIELLDRLSQKTEIIHPSLLPAEPIETPLGAIDLRKLNDVTLYRGNSAAAEIARDLTLASYLGFFKLFRRKGALMKTVGVVMLARRLAGTFSAAGLEGPKPIYLSWSVWAALRYFINLNQNKPDWLDKHKDADGQIAFFQETFGERAKDLNGESLHAAVSDLLSKQAKESLGWPVIHLNLGDAVRLRDEFKRKIADPDWIRSHSGDDGQIKFYEEVFGNRAPELHAGNLHSAISDIIPKRLAWLKLHLNVAVAKSLRQALNTKLKQPGRADWIKENSGNRGQIRFYEDALGEGVNKLHARNLYAAISSLLPKSGLHWTHFDMNFADAKKQVEAGFGAEEAEGLRGLMGELDFLHETQRRFLAGKIWKAIGHDRAKAARIISEARKFSAQFPIPGGNGNVPSEDFAALRSEVWNNWMRNVKRNRLLGAWGREKIQSMRDQVYEQGKWTAPQMHLARNIITGAYVLELLESNGAGQEEHSDKRNAAKPVPRRETELQRLVPRENEIVRRAKAEIFDPAFERAKRFPYDESSVRPTPQDKNDGLSILAFPHRDKALIEKLVHIQRAAQSELPFVREKFSAVPVDQFHLTLKSVLKPQEIPYTGEAVKTALEEARQDISRAPPRHVWLEGLTIDEFSGSIQIQVFHLLENIQPPLSTITLLTPERPLTEGERQSLHTWIGQKRNLALGRWAIRRAHVVYAAHGANAKPFHTVFDLGRPIPAVPMAGFSRPISMQAGFGADNFDVRKRDEKEWEKEDLENIKSLVDQRTGNRWLSAEIFSSIARIAKQFQPTRVAQNLPREIRPFQLLSEGWQINQPSMNSNTITAKSPARTQGENDSKNRDANAPAQPTLTISINVLAIKFLRVASSIMGSFPQTILGVVVKAINNLYVIIPRDRPHVNYFMSFGFSSVAGISPKLLGVQPTAGFGAKDISIVQVPPDISERFDKLSVEAAQAISAFMQPGDMPRHFWETVPLDAQRLMVEILSEAVQRVPGDLREQHFSVKLPPLGNKTLGGMFAFYRNKNGRPLSSVNTLKALKSALGFAHKPSLKEFRWKELNRDEERVKEILGVPDLNVERLESLIRSRHALTKLEEEELALEIRNGNGAARDAAIFIHKHLISFAIRRYVFKWKEVITRADVWEVAEKELRRRIEVFSLIPRSYRFSTYAVPALVDRILRQIKKTGREIGDLGEDHSALDNVVSMAKTADSQGSQYERFEEVIVQMTKYLRDVGVSDQNLLIFQLRKDGMTFREIGESVGLNRWQVRKNMGALVELLRSKFNEEDLFAAGFGAASDGDFPARYQMLKQPVTLDELLRHPAGKVLTSFPARDGRQVDVRIHSIFAGDHNQRMQAMFQFFLPAEENRLIGQFSFFASRRGSKLDKIALDTLRIHHAEDGKLGIGRWAVEFLHSLSMPGASIEMATNNTAMIRLVHDYFSFTAEDLSKFMRDLLFAHNSLLTMIDPEAPLGRGREVATYLERSGSFVNRNEALLEKYKPRSVLVSKDGAVIAFDKNYSEIKEIAVMLAEGVNLKGARRDKISFGFGAENRTAAEDLLKWLERRVPSLAEKLGGRKHEKKLAALANLANPNKGDVRDILQSTGKYRPGINLAAGELDRLLEALSEFRSTAEAVEADLPQPSAASEPSLVQSDSLLAVLGRGIEVNFHVPVSAKREGYWLYTLDLSQKERDAINARVFPARSSHLDRLNRPTLIQILFKDDDPQIILSDGLAWEQLPEDLRARNLEAQMKRIKESAAREGKDVPSELRALEKSLGKTVFALGYALFAMDGNEAEIRFQNATHWREAHEKSAGTYSSELFEIGTTQSGQTLIYTKGVYPPGSLSSYLFEQGIRPKPGSSVLVLGGGAGGNAIVAAERGAGDIVETDIGLLEVEIARFNASRSPYASKIQVVQADLFELPAELRKKKYDHIYFNIPLIGRGEDEDITILDPGGVLLDRYLRQAGDQLNEGGTVELNYAEVPSFFSKVYEYGWEPAVLEGTDLTRDKLPQMSRDYVRVTLVRQSERTARQDELARLSDDWKFLAELEERFLEQEKKFSAKQMEKLNIRVNERYPEFLYLLQGNVDADLKEAVKSIAKESSGFGAASASGRNPETEAALDVAGLQNRETENGTNGFPQNGFVDDIKEILMHIGNAGSIIEEPMAERPAHLDFYHLDIAFDNAREMAISNPENLQAIIHALRLGRNQLIKILLKIHQDQKSGFDKDRLKHMWGIVEGDLDALEIHIQEALRLTRNLVTAIEWQTADVPVAAVAVMTDANAASGFGKRAEFDVRRAIDQVTLHTTTMIDYRDMARNFSKEQVEELFAWAYLYPEKVRLVIYNADLKDRRLKPFMQLSKNVRVSGERAEDAYRKAQQFFRTPGSEKHVTIHLSKAGPGAKAELRQEAGDIFFFRYRASDAASGLLAAALLYVQYADAGKKLDGIGTDGDGYLTIIGEFLRSVVQLEQVRLVVAMAA